MKIDKENMMLAIPLSWIGRVMVLAIALIAMVIPVRLSVYAAESPPFIFTQEMLAFKMQVQSVEAELIPKMKGIPASEIPEVAKAIVKESWRHGFDPFFILSIIEVESGFDNSSCSKGNAKGIMQIVPSTFKQFSDSPKIFDPVVNVRAGTKYLASLLNDNGFKRPESLLLAYNGGPGAAGRYLKASKEEAAYYSSEMRAYPGKVLGIYRRLLAKAGKDPKAVKKYFKTDPITVPDYFASR
jgi:soluble lytic murein transglycosylase-like protein